MAGWIVQAHINAGGTGHAVARNAKVRQGADRGLFEAVDVLFHKVPPALKIKQRVGHHLPRAVVRHLPAPVGGHHGNAARGQHMLGLAGQPLGKGGRVLAQPQRIGRVRPTRCGHALHGSDGAGVIHPAKKANVQGSRSAGLHQSTTLTLGWPVRARYKLSNCSRLVAVTVMVTPKYFPPLLGRNSTVFSS